MTDTDIRRPDPRLLENKEHCAKGHDLKLPGALYRAGTKQDGRPRLVCDACRRAALAKKPPRTFTHCKVCGLFYARPRRWSYCGQACRAEGVASLRPLSSNEVVMEILRLDRQLEHDARPWEKDEIRARIKALESKVRN